MSEKPFNAERNFFENLSSDLQQLVRERAHRAHHKAGLLIHQRGDEPSCISLIRNGRVRMSNVARNGDRITIAELGAGESFGLFPLLSGSARSHDAHAQSDVELLELGKAALHRTMDDAPQLRDHIILHLSSRLVRALEMIEDERRYPLRFRLAKLLARRADAAGNVRATQNALADELGVSRFGLGLALKEFAEAGLVETGYGSVTICDQSRLYKWIADNR